MLPFSASGAAVAAAVALAALVVVAVCPAPCEGEARVYEDEFGNIFINTSTPAQAILVNGMDVTARIRSLEQRMDAVSRLIAATRATPPMATEPSTTTAAASTTGAPGTTTDQGPIVAVPAGTEVDLQNPSFELPEVGGNTALSAVESWKVVEDGAGVMRVVASDFPVSTDGADGEQALFLMAGAQVRQNTSHTFEARATLTVSLGVGWPTAVADPGTPCISLTTTTTNTPVHQICTSRMAQQRGAFKAVGFRHTLPSTGPFLGEKIQVRIANTGGNRTVVDRITITIISADDEQTTAASTARATTTAGHSPGPSTTTAVTTTLPCEEAMLRPEAITGFSSGCCKWSDGVLAANSSVIYGIPFSSDVVLMIATDTNTADTTTLRVETNGGYKWQGGVLSNTGKIYGIPYNADAVLIIDPASNTLDETTLSELPSSTSPKWAGGALAPDGRIFGIPYNADPILIIDPSTNTLDAITGLLQLGNKWRGAVLAPDGLIYSPPDSENDVLIIDPNEDTYTTIAAGGSGWSGAMLADGSVYALPFSSSSILEITTGANPATSKHSLPQTASTVCCKWQGGAVSSVDGRIYALPLDATPVLIFDPATSAIDETTLTVDTGGWSATVEAPNGRLYGIPYSATSVAIVDPAALHACEQTGLP